jgi:hypothetical protein
MEGQMQKFQQFPRAENGALFDASLEAVWIPVAHCPLRSLVPTS